MNTDKTEGSVCFEEDERTRVTDLIPYVGRELFTKKLLPYKDSMAYMSVLCIEKKTPEPGIIIRSNYLIL